jgi:hypothetical protein
MSTQMKDKLYSLLPGIREALIITLVCVCGLLLINPNFSCSRDNTSSNDFNIKLYKKYEESYNKLKDSLQQEYDLLMLSRDSVSTELTKLRESHPSVQYVTKYSANSRVVKELRQRAQKLQDSLIDQRMFLISEYHYLEDSLENVHDYYTNQMAEIINIIQENTIVVPFKSNYEDDYISLGLEITLDSTKTKSLTNYDITFRDSLVFSHAVQRTRPWPFGRKTYTVSAVSTSPYIKDQKVNGYTFRRR